MRREALTAKSFYRFVSCSFINCLIYFYAYLIPQTQLLRTLTFSVFADSDFLWFCRLWFPLIFILWFHLFFHTLIYSVFRLWFSLFLQTMIYSDLLCFFRLWFFLFLQTMIYSDLLWFSDSDLLCFCRLWFTLIFRLWFPLFFRLWFSLLLRLWFTLLFLCFSSDLCGFNQQNFSVTAVLL